MGKSVSCDHSKTDTTPNDDHVYEPRATKTDYSTKTTRLDTTDSTAITYEKLNQGDTPKYEPVINGNNSKAIYSELGQGGGRDHRDTEQTRVAPSNYADAKEIKEGRERDYLPAPPIKQKDMFDRVDDDYA